MANCRVFSVLFVATALSACAHRPMVIAEVPPPPVSVAAPPMPRLPAGVSPTMPVPARLVDGSYATPNRGLTPAATLWHFRVALNVAALACRGPEGDMIVARYNAMLAQRRGTLAAAQTRFAAEWRTGGGDWQARYDDAMTRLYNYFSLSPARTAFCAAAAQTLADSTSIADDALSGFATAALPALDRPFTEVYRAVDAWRMAQAAPSPRPVIALAAVPATVPTRIHPRLELDPSVFQ